MGEKIKLCHTDSCCPTVEEIIIDGKITGLKVIDEDGGEWDFDADDLDWLFKTAKMFRVVYPQTEEIAFTGDNEEIIFTLTFEYVEMLKEVAKEKGLI